MVLGTTIDTSMVAFMKSHHLHTQMSVATAQKRIPLPLSEQWEKLLSRNGYGASQGQIHVIDRSLERYTIGTRESLDV